MFTANKARVAVAIIKPPHDEQGRCVRDKVGKTAVQQGHRDNAVHSADVTGDQTEGCVQAIATDPIDDLNRPQQGDEGGKRSCSVEEGVHSVLSAHDVDGNLRSGGFNGYPRRPAGQP
ncbi:hypothetical protein [Marivita sp.]|uniref:hypothetical protein n=1 Tax=Marivita sp. TaxID=2003365 RepID=UPI00261CEAE3|nr:hypothetical protein [Marivita sp.]